MLVAACSPTGVSNPATKFSTHERPTLFHPKLQCRFNLHETTTTIIQVFSFCGIKFRQMGTNLTASTLCLSLLLWKVSRFQQLSHLLPHGASASAHQIIHRLCSDDKDSLISSYWYLRPMVSACAGASPCIC